ncbi:serine/threonine-protein kinase [Nocardia transvalensis]|uniref:non-specific serine/threonine protein kinase n=1 Tax=Nocardia transvalensis TaxID=37333 RepID=A0A7W9PBA8_9NOCA|nr:serine/threonine-protein kinase [Nocardia transvalensis]MBB5912805.1 serine/threonine-protein kinase [Nocardia transvalensis]
MAMSPGTIVGGYRIERVLGAGGMGTVYLGKHPSLPRMDAIKVLGGELSSNAEFRGRFEREANLAAGLDHPNIVSVYNRGEEHGQLWIAMQYVEGTDASAELARDPHAMTPLRALRIVTEVGKGLDYAHRRGLLHRDVKPANFLLSRDDEEERVLLTDFGVAKSTDDATELTQTGSFVATIAYAPPEQLQGMQVDHRGDIYSLACALYKLVTNQNPYPATQPAMVMMGHLYEPPPRATAVNPNLPNALDHIFARAMAKNPAERFNTCREFTDAAANALMPGHNPVHSNTSPTYPIQVPDSRPRTDPRVALSAPGRPDFDVSSLTKEPPNPRKKWILGGSAAAVVVALAAGLGIWATQSGGGGTTTTTTTAATPTAIATVADARKANPAFEGKTVTMVDVTGSEYGKFGIYLSGTTQTQFLEGLGFVYNLSYAKNGDETSPRPAPDSYPRLSAPSDSYILAVRSDEKAGGGGLIGLPYEITQSRATVIPIDEPAVVAAIRNWSPNSEKTLLDKLIPVLHTRIK